MQTFQIVENFGVAVTAGNVGLCTTTLSSCSAIIMHNSATRTLGLYHYPGQALSASGVQQAIVLMINDIAPDHLVLWPAHVTDMGYLNVSVQKKAVLLDNAKVRTFLELKKSSACTLEQKAGETFPGVQMIDGVVTFEAIMASAEVPSADTIVAGSQSCDRKQKGSARFYYGSSEGRGNYGRKIQDAATRILEIERFG